ncbi:AMP-binding protein [Candidatus Peregrinibacteria bacterium]|nr:AMP-binding protein [Candidatus Peregrinibacteria bacterium]
MLGKDVTLPSHVRGEKDFPPDYRDRLRWGTKEDRLRVNQEIIDTLPVRNIGAFVEFLAHRYGDRVALRESPDEDTHDANVLTYHQLLESVCLRACELLRLGIQHGERVGIVSENNIDALVLKLACQYIGAIVLPWTERIEEAGMTTAEAMERAHVPWLALHEERSIHHVLGADSVEFPHINMLRSTQHIFGVTHKDDERIVRAIGQPVTHDMEQSELRDRSRHVGISDNAIIFYSPGTGGLSSKMVEVSHANMLYQYCVTPGVLNAPPGVRYLHILPPYHVFGETMLGMALSMGGEVTLADLRCLKKGGPSLLQDGRFELFAAIPDFWRYLRTSIEQKVPGFVRSVLARDMVRVAWADIARARRTGDVCLIEKTDMYWKSFLQEYAKNIPEGSACTAIKTGIRAAIAHLLYPTIRRRAGIGSLRWGISGGAKLLAEDYAFFSALKGSPDYPGIELHSGYGLTEAGVCGIAKFGEGHFAASVGDTVAGSVAWIEKNADGNEEICIAGPGVSQYRDAGLQEELVPDQALHTGDQGKVVEIATEVLTAARQVILHERQLKRMVKWKGASMLPVPMEALLKESPMIKDALVVGNGQDRLGVLIFPKIDTIKEYCLEHPMDGFDPDHPEWSHPGIRFLFQHEVEKRLRLKIVKQRAYIDSFRIIGDVPPDIRMASGAPHPRKTEEYFAAEIAAMWNGSAFALKKGI